MRDFYIPQEKQDEICKQVACTQGNNELLYARAWRLFKAEITANNY